MGVLLRKDVDGDAFDEMLQEIQSIVRIRPSESTFVEVKKEPGDFKAQNTKVVRKRQKAPKSEKSVGSAILSAASNFLFGEKGHCIRCGEAIDFNPDSPLCDDCFVSWSKFKNAKYIEHYCHSCGEHRKTTKAKPICRACYSKKD